MFCLTCETSPAWVQVALGELDQVLVDHAHCEMKAATTALSLAVKGHTSLEMVQRLSALAAEEVDHFQRVVAWLQRRGLSLGVPPVNRYAALLHEAVKALPPTGLDSLVDRLLIGAMIEARSCERFKALLDAWPSVSDAGGEAGAEDELRVFYQELFECEAGHYVTYCDLARDIAPHSRETVDARLKVIAEVEAQIVNRLAQEGPRPTVHG